MDEDLLVYALLLDVGIISHFEYNEYLDEQFIKMPDNELLLELEWCFSETQKTISIIHQYCNYSTIDYTVFGRFLFSKLKDIYFQNRMELKSFAEKSYIIWKKLPNTVCQTEPFWTLSYADDPLSWGDEKQTRELYEKAFNFYNIV